MARKRANMSEEEKIQQRLVDKERKASYRASLSEELKVENQKIVDKERKARKRSNMPEEERINQRLADKERKASYRASLSEEQKVANKEIDRKRKAKSVIADDSKSKQKEHNSYYLKHEREFNRLYKKKLRDGSSEADHEYEIIYNLLCMRNLREERNGKEHLLDNLDARKEMRNFRKFGPLKEFRERKLREIDELELWHQFSKKGVEYEKILIQKKPEMAQKVKELCEKRRNEALKKLEEEEKTRIEERERRERGIWEWNGNSESYHWTGKEPPGPDDTNPDEGQFYYESPVQDDETKEQEDLIFKWWCETQEEIKRQDREERNRLAREKYHEKKLALLKPIELPESEPSEYEKIREQIISEREAAMKAAGY